MKIELTPVIQKSTDTGSVQLPENNNNVQEVKQKNPQTTVASPEVKRSLDEATGLLQAIVTDKMSDKIIRKMPTDEYLELLSLLDDIVSGSIDKKV